tara:strand:- start:154910 stop:155461 length:552 start_codon:yes stop_codon:yes gene_type:complete
MTSLELAPAETARPCSGNSCPVILVRHSARRWIMRQRAGEKLTGQCQTIAVPSSKGCHSMRCKATITAIVESEKRKRNSHRNYRNTRCRDSVRREGFLSLCLIVCASMLLGGQTDVGGGGDFDQLNAPSKDGHCGEDDNAGFDDFSVANKVQPHSQQVKAEQDKKPACDFSGLEHQVYPYKWL